MYWVIYSHLLSVATKEISQSLPITSQQERLTLATNSPTMIPTSKLPAEGSRRKIDMAKPETP